MRQIWAAADFIRKTRRQLRFGKLSRSPLHVLRFELQGETAECEWIARQPDAWDSDLQPRIRNYNASLQALQDALALRELLFSEFPGMQTAVLRAYREIEGQAPELIIEGLVERSELAPKDTPSLVMRAKLEGLRFWLDDGTLEALQQEKQDGASRHEPAFV